MTLKYKNDALPRWSIPTLRTPGLEVEMQRQAAKGSCINYTASAGEQRDALKSQALLLHEVGNVRTRQLNLIHRRCITAPHIPLPTRTEGGSGNDGDFLCIEELQ